MKKRTISKLIAGAAMAAALFIGSAGTAVATVSAAEDAGQATTVETTDDSTSVKANYHNTIKLVSLNGSSKVANSNVEVGQDMVFMFDLRAYGKFYLEKYTIQIIDSKGKFAQTTQTTSAQATRSHILSTQYRLIKQM